MKHMVKSVWVKNLDDSFFMQSGLKQGDALESLLYNFALNLPLGKSRKNQTRWTEIKWDTAAVGLLW
jgi:hypothetical protein